MIFLADIMAFNNVETLTNGPLTDNSWNLRQLKTSCKPLIKGLQDVIEAPR